MFDLFVKIVGRILALISTLYLFMFYCVVYSKVMTDPGEGMRIILYALGATALTVGAVFYIRHKLNAYFDNSPAPAEAPLPKVVRLPVNRRRKPFQTKNTRRGA